MFFDDGASPPKEIIAQWIAVVSSTFDSSPPADGDSPCIAVHCIAGLGRYFQIYLNSSFYSHRW